MMKKYILLLIVIVSCKNENQYKLALDEYIKEDLHFKQARINYQLEEFELWTQEYNDTFYQKKYLYYKAKYKEASALNLLCVEFENKTLNKANIDSINVLYKKLKTSILKQEFVYNKFVKEEVEKLPIRVESTTQKYNVLRKLKELNYKINDFELKNHQPSTLVCNLGINYTSILATRLNDNEIVLNIYSEIAKGYSEDFDDNSFKIKKIEDSKNNPLSILKYNNDVIESYIIKSKSDTLYLDAILKTKKRIGLLIAGNNSRIIVGEHKIFNKNYLDDYFNYRGFNKN